MKTVNPFDTARTGTGTAEWAEVNVNIALGCQNDCLYCYAAHNANRFALRPRAEWHREELTKRAEMTSYPTRKGVIMFPSAHDITPFNVEPFTRVARLILAKGNNLLIVSKPRIDCIRQVMAALDPYKDQILFRFTIGTMNPTAAAFWEPGAPEPAERIEALRAAHSEGFKTSVSIEPIIDGIENAVAVVSTAQNFVTETIWIGKMNQVRRRLDMTNPTHREAAQCIETLQCDSEIRKLYRFLKSNPLIRWKDSIKKVIEGEPF